MLKAWRFTRPRLVHARPCLLHHRTPLLAALPTHTKHLYSAPGPRQVLSRGSWLPRSAAMSSTNPGPGLGGVSIGSGGLSEEVISKEETTPPQNPLYDASHTDPDQETTTPPRTVREGSQSSHVFHDTDPDQETATPPRTVREGSQSSHVFDDTDPDQETTPPLTVREGSQPSHDVAREGGSPVDGDPSDGKFTYLSKGFTSEIYKIRLANIPGRMGYNNLRKYFTSLALNPVKIKKPNQQSDTAFITFRSEEERVLALKTLDGKVWKSRTLKAKVADPAPDPRFLRKRPTPEDVVIMEAKRAKIQSMTLEERLHSAVTPWLDIPYPEQLRKKELQLRTVLKDMAYRIMHKDSMPGEWFRQHIKNHDGMVCPLEPMRYSSAALKGYRNKCEFAIGRCPSGTGVVVGFRLGSYEDGDFDVASAATCHHVSKRTKELAEVFEIFFNQSLLEPFSSKYEEGHWRMVSLRCYQSGETMAIVQLHPQDLTKAEIEVQKSKLAKFFSTGEGARAPPTSLYFQALGRLEANVEPSYEHLLGEKCVHEDLLGLKFRISPAAFFQVNTTGAELLYSLIADLAVTEGVQHPIIYDICCGTGTIGLCLAKGLHARKVVGVEMEEQAVEDAKVNARLNGVSNVEFVCGKAEDVMSNIDLPWAKRGEIIGIVDPPRGGLHPKVTRSIRDCYPIQKLIYVSCNPNGAKQNIVDLCRKKSNRVKGVPFRVVSATPVDMFPHTPHCELVMLLERVKEGQVLGRKRVRVTEEELAVSGVKENDLKEGGVVEVEGKDTSVGEVERVKEEELAVKENDLKEDGVGEVEDVDGVQKVEEKETRKMLTQEEP